MAEDRQTEVINEALSAHAERAEILYEVREQRKKIDQLEQVVSRGNGHKPLTERVTTLEAEVDAIKSGLDEMKGDIRMIKVVEDSGSYGIILRQAPSQEKADVNYIEECIALFDRIKEDKKVRIFHVTGVDGIEGAGDGLRLINETSSFVENIFPYKRVFSKYELVLVSNCIYIQITGGQLKKNYMDLMEPFRKEGSNKARQLLETLETFVLDAGMNSAKTSDFLDVHTNTVQYRLKKINEILGAEITGNRVIPGLTVALALRRMENGNNR